MGQNGLLSPRGGAHHPGLALGLAVRRLHPGVMVPSPRHSRGKPALNCWLLAQSLPLWTLGHALGSPPQLNKLLLIFSFALKV